MPGEMSFGLLFLRIWINLESFNFLQNNHFLIKIHFSLKTDFFEKKSIICPIVDLKVGSDWLADQEWFLA